MSQSQIEHNQQFIKMPELTRLLQIKKSTVYNYMDENSPYFKPDFPKRIKLGRSTVWRLGEVYQYMDSLVGRGGENNG